MGSTRLEKSRSPQMQGRKGKGWAKPVGAHLSKLTRPAFERFGFPAAQLITDWPAIAGPDLARFAVPEKLRWPQQVDTTADEGQPARQRSAKGWRGEEGATLVLRVEGPRALEVQFKTEQILERVNSYFGYCAVTAIRIVQAPVNTRAEPLNLDKKSNAPQTPLPKIKGIESDRLREALARLGKGVTEKAKQGASGSVDHHKIRKIA